MHHRFRCVLGDTINYRTTLSRYLYLTPLVGVECHVCISFQTLTQAKVLLSAPDPDFLKVSKYTHLET